VSVLQVSKEMELQRLFKTQALALQDAVQHILDWAGGQSNKKTTSSLQALMHHYIDKACALAAGLGLLEAPPPATTTALQAAGNEALSKTPPHRATPGQAPQATVPARNVFDHILNALPSMATVEDNSIAEVERALARIKPAAELDSSVQVPQPTSPVYFCNSELRANPSFNMMSPQPNSTLDPCSPSDVPALHGATAISATPALTNVTVAQAQDGWNQQQQQSLEAASS